MSTTGAMTFIYRVQDATGRGPWRPGFSHLWIDEHAPVGRLSETVMDLVPLAVLRALPTDRHYGCGCRTMAALREWFTPAERLRLTALGFDPVRLRVDQILAESDWQMFFSRTRPLWSGASVHRWDA